MDDRTRTLLDDAVGTHIAEYGEVLPPWEAYPDTGRFSIGWRMGDGEWHLMVWDHWWQVACLDEASRLAYIRRHLPPAQWLDWAAEAIWPDAAADDDSEFNHAAVRRLSEHGIGSYDAWQTWIDGTG